MKRFLVGILLISSFIYGNYAYSGDDRPAAKCCHRCGMVMNSGGLELNIAGQPQWQECCPMCAFADVVECGCVKALLSGRDDHTGDAINIDFIDGKISTIKPESIVILIGGSCPKNHIFTGTDNANAYIASNSWANADMIKPAATAFKGVKRSKKSLTRCAMCTAPLKGHIKTSGTIITDKGRRMRLCCGHCLLFSVYRLGKNAKRIVTTDFVSGESVNARQAWFVVGNDLVLCCYPSTISFRDRSAAELFQKKHGGTVMSFDQSLDNIEHVMGKARGKNRNAGHKKKN